MAKAHPTASVGIILNHYLIHPYNFIYSDLCFSECEGRTAFGHVIFILERRGKTFVHAQAMEGDQTLLGNTRNSKELFKIQNCDIIPISLITKLVDIKHEVLILKIFNRIFLNLNI